jgi:peptidoglycan hydrolase CwlO-like protein
MLADEINTLKHSHDELQKLSQRGHTGMVEGLRQQVSRIQRDLVEYGRLRQEISDKIAEQINMIEKLTKDIQDQDARISDRKKLLDD